MSAPLSHRGASNVEDRTSAAAGGSLAARQTAATKVAPASLGSALCVFGIGGKAYGLDVRLVGEVVQVERVTPVPGAQEGVLGIFSLRGQPVALLDLDAVLRLSQSSEHVEVAKESTALVLLVGQTPIAAMRVERVHAVIGTDSVSPRGVDRSLEHAAVRALLDTKAHGVVTMLDEQVVLASLSAMRFR